MGQEEASAERGGLDGDPVGRWEPSIRELLVAYPRIRRLFSRGVLLFQPKSAKTSLS
jgi:hypothetical protein